MDLQSWFPESHHLRRRDQFEKMEKMEKMEKLDLEAQVDFCETQILKVYASLKVWYSKPSSSVQM